MIRSPVFWFNYKLFLGVVAILLVTIALYNWYVAAIGTILLYVYYLFARNRHAEDERKWSQYCHSISYNADQATCYALQNLPLAIAIVEQDGTLFWSNSVLSDWFGEAEASNPLPAGMLRDLEIAKLWDKSGMLNAKNGERYYQILYRPTLADSAGGPTRMMLYVSDITASEMVKEDCYADKMVFMYIQIDNYDDALKGLSDAQRSSILAEVGAKLVDMTVDYGGFLKQYNTDSYVAVINRNALEGLMDGRFEVLDVVRSIKNGNKIPITLSIGAAADHETPAESAQKAQAGLDLALGRGGDQAVVYAGGKIQFYGGQAKAIEKNTRVKARVVAQAIRELIADSQNVLVMGHAGEDFDSLGAALGVAKMVRHADRRVNIVVSHLGVAMQRMTELLPDYDGYEHEFITPTQASLLVNAKTLLVVVDVHRPSLTAAPELLMRTERTVVIDHHRRAADDFISNPLLVYLEPSASSASEMVTELLQYYDDNIDLNRLEASCLYAGLVVDTKNFAVQTGVRTFEAASYLRRSGADPSLVRQLFRVDFMTMKDKAQSVANTTVLPGGAALAHCPNEVKNAQIVAAQVADMLLTVEGIRVSFVLFALEEGGIGISARSKGEVNVQLLMEELDGGGHQSVAGAQLRNSSRQEAEERLLAIIDKYMQESGSK